MKRLGVGLIGTGFMGRAHALAFRNAQAVFELPMQLELHALADADANRAESCAATWGFTRSHATWQALIDDPQVGLVAITTPNQLHAPMALAALAAGKSVYCEKPLAISFEQAGEMRDAARKAGVVTRVGYNYQQNPILEWVRDYLRSGLLGSLLSFNGEFSEDFMADPLAPFNWRCRIDQAGGALADLGSHILAMSRYLMGDVAEVCADLQNVHSQRPLPGESDESAPVAVDDQAHILLRFSNGARGTVHTSWLAHGRKNRLAFEIRGTLGTLVFDQERLNELRLYRVGDSGFQTLLAGPHLPGYAAFCPAPGHQLGYNELKTLEVRELVEAIAGNPSGGVDFEEAWQIERLAAAARESARSRRWVRL